MFGWLAEGGLKRPFRVLTMDQTWWEVAEALELPRYFFKDKLRMMQFVLRNGYQDADVRPVALIAKDGTDKTREMIASFYAMGAVDLSFNPD